MRKERVDTASRVIRAPPQAIYRAFLSADAWTVWLPPAGMSARMQRFEPWSGGRYRMILTYDHPDHAAPGKTSADSDVVNGRFVEFVTDRRVVQEVEFASDDPAFAGVMRMTWSLRAAGNGTEVRMRCRRVPEGIRAEDHRAGMRSSLENLAAFVEAESCS